MLLKIKEKTIIRFSVSLKLWHFRLGISHFVRFGNIAQLTIPKKMPAVHLTIMLSHLKSAQITAKVLNIVYYAY